MEVKNENLIIQPRRFAKAYYNFSPTQRDIIALIQREANHCEGLNRNFNLNLKKYFLDKGVDLRGLRKNNINTILDNIITTNVTFEPIEGGLTKINLIEKITITDDLLLNVLITESALPLFYINQLKLKDSVSNNKEIPYIIEKEKELKYIGYLPSVFISFQSFPVKRLYELLLQYKTIKKKTFEFSKTELYLWLGFANLNETEKDQLFLIKSYEVEEIKYKGSQGWQTLSKYLDKWLKEISDNEFSGVNIIKQGKKHYKTVGRPIRKIVVDVEYNSEIIHLSKDKQEGIEFLKKYKLSNKQMLSVVNRFTANEIKDKIRFFIVSKVDHKGNKFYAQLQKPNHDKIKNIQGFIYAVVFKLGDA